MRPVVMLSDRAADTPTISPESFDRQMAILAQRWKPISLPAVIESLRGGKPLPERAVAVTFDDGTTDNFRYAFPILRKHRIPATIFLITGQIEKPGFLSAEQITEMAREGVYFGSHCVDHEYLPSLSPAALEETVRESKKTIEGLGLHAEFISYPGGGYTTGVIEAARKAGYLGGCTTNRGFRRFPPDPWAMRRITMHENAVTPAGLWLRCCGWYGLNRRLRQPA